MSDGSLWLLTNAAFWGLTPLPWNELLFTEGPALFLAPLLYVIHSAWFFWIGATTLAMFSILASALFFRIFKRLFLSGFVVVLTSFLIAFHPLMHQLHFYWMKEFTYIVFVFLGLYLAALSIQDASAGKAVEATVVLFMGVLMRSQAFIGLMVGLIALTGTILWQSGRPWASTRRRRAGLILGLWAIPIILVVPFRWVNYYRYGYFLMNQTLGWNMGVYMQYAGSYYPENGPQSRQLDRWSRELTAHSTTYARPTLPPEDLALAVGYAGGIVEARRMHYLSAKWIAYAITGDWILADRFVQSVALEAIKAHPLKYLVFVRKHVKWYFTAISENPVEWHKSFQPQNVVEIHSVYHLKVGDVKAVPLGGLAYSYPQVMLLYNPLRSAFAHGMTWLKKITFVLLPFLLYVYAKRGPPLTAIYLSLLAATHLLTGTALGLIVLYHHRFNAPLDFFTLVYLGAWLDIAARTQWRWVRTAVF